MLRRRRVELPPELQVRQKLLARGHNRRVMFLAAAFFGTIFIALIIFQRDASVAIIVFITGFVFLGYIGLVLIPRADIRQCMKVGFVCPFCGEALYYQSSIVWKYSSLITRGECPHCGKSFVQATSSI